MLSPQDRSRYDAFVSEYTLPVFYRSWYLDAVAGPQNWSCVFADDKDDTLAGIWPYFRKKRLTGLVDTLDKPPYCLFFGPWLAPPKTAMNTARALSRQHRLYQQLADQLPSATIKRAYLFYDQRQLLPLRTLGWESRLYQSYRLPTNLYQEEEIRGRFDPKVRHELKGYSSLKDRIVPIENINVLLQLEEDNLGWRSSKAAFNRPLLKRLLHSAKDNNSARGWLFHNNAGEPIAGVWLPYDQQSAYLLIAVSNPILRSADNAVTQLIWHAIRWAISQKLIFDFEGSSLPGVEAFYRGWGPEVATYAGVAWKRWWWLPG